jgi:hypothetical protein
MHGISAHLIDFSEYARSSLPYPCLWIWYRIYARSSPHHIHGMEEDTKDMISLMGETYYIHGVLLHPMDITLPCMLLEENLISFLIKKPVFF